MTTIPPEQELVDSLCRQYFQSGYEVRTEVSNMGQSIDIVVLVDGKIMAIEVKRTDWKRGLEQCRAHFLVADYVLLALGKPILTPLTLSSVNKGLGILFHDPEWRVKAKAHQSTRIWQPQRDRFIAQMKEVPLFDGLESPDAPS